MYTICKFIYVDRHYVNGMVSTVTQEAENNSATDISLTNYFFIMTNYKLLY